MYLRDYISLLGLCCAFLTSTASQAGTGTPETLILYQANCAVCHGENRLGGMGPALLPGNLKRLRQKAAVEVIKNGRPATQMPAFAEKLSDKDIQALSEYIYTPLQETPVWGLTEINASHIIHNPVSDLPDKPVFKVDDLLNLFLVVELGDHHVTLLDGDRMEPIHRFKSRFALHGGPKYSASGRFVYFASRDGWISKYDIYNLKLVAEIRAGINTRNLAVSADGRYVMVANYLPHSLVLLDATDLQPIKLYDVKDSSGTDIPRQCRLYRTAAQQFYCRAQGYPGGLGNLL